jgi:hypothetical protein
MIMKEYRYPSFLNIVKVFPGFSFTSCKDLITSVLLKLSISLSFLQNCHALFTWPCAQPSVMSRYYSTILTKGCMKK